MAKASSNEIGTGGHPSVLISHKFKTTPKAHKTRQGASRNHAKAKELLGVGKAQRGTGVGNWGRSDASVSFGSPKQVRGSGTVDGGFERKQRSTPTVVPGAALPWPRRGRVGGLSVCRRYISWRNIPQQGSQLNHPPRHHLIANHFTNQCCGTPWIGS